MKGTAITHSDDLNAWLYGVKEGLINKTRYSLIPEDDEVAQFYTSHQLQCISNGAQGLATGGGMVANNDALVGKSVRNPAEFHDYSNSRPFKLQNFHRNFIF
jgi:hypothetical protein